MISSNAFTNFLFRPQLYPLIYAIAHRCTGKDQRNIHKESFNEKKRQKERGENNLNNHT